MNLKSKQNTELVHCTLHLSVSKHYRKEVIFVILTSIWETEAKMKENDLHSVIIVDCDRHYPFLRLGVN